MPERSHWNNLRSHPALRVTSYVRPGKLFTASGDLIAKEVGVLAPEALAGVIDAVTNLL
jgi:hypothetical protein